MNKEYKDRIEHFLEQKHIAVAGYSTDKRQVANILYKKFQDNGYQVSGINPKADQIEDITCFPNLKAVPEKIDAVMISTHPNATLEVVKECIELGINHVWIHSSFGKGSYNEDAFRLADENNMEIIPNACPMMFLKPDGAHRCFRWFMNISGKLKV